MTGKAKTAPEPGETTTRENQMKLIRSAAVVGALAIVFAGIAGTASASAATPQSRPSVCVFGTTLAHWPVHSQQADICRVVYGS